MEKVLYDIQPDKKVWYYWILTTGLGASIGYAFFFFIAYWMYKIFTLSIPKSAALPIPFRASVYFLALVFILHIPYLYFLLKTYKYSITDKMVIFEGGIFYKKKKYVPFYKVTNVEVYQGILEQLLKIYRINVQTAGTGGTPIPEIVFEGLVETEKPRKIILEKIKHARTQET